MENSQSMVIHSSMARHDQGFPTVSRGQGRDPVLPFRHDSTADIPPNPKELHMLDVNDVIIF